MQPEARLTKKIIEALRAEGALAVKIHGGTFQSRGLPDVVGCHDSIFLGFEVKMPGKEKTITQLQRKKLWDIASAGGIGMMVTSPQQAIRYLYRGREVIRAGGKVKPNVEPPEES